MKMVKINYSTIPVSKRVHAKIKSIKRYLRANSFNTVIKKLIKNYEENEKRENKSETLRMDKKAPQDSRV